MAKKYYWLKLKQDFFEDDVINWIEEQKNGKDYVIFYLKLCLKSIKNEGTLIRKVGDMLIPYDKQKLSEITKTPIDTVVVAMQLFEKLNLISILENGEIYINQMENMIGSETDKAQLMRNKREREKELNGNNVTNLLLNCYTEKEIDKELDIDLNKDKDIDINKEKYIKQNDIMHGSELTNGNIKNDQLMEEKLHTYGRKGNDPMEENFHTPMEEKVRDNITVFNNTINITNNKKSKEAEIEDFFLSLWYLYPNKKSKTKVSKESKKKIYSIGLEHMQRAILRYRKEVENIEIKYIKHGSSFFNSGYIDYLDENYTGTNDIYKKFDGDDDIIQNIDTHVKMKRKDCRNLILNYSQETIDIMIERLNNIKEKGEKFNKSDYEWILEQLQIENVKAI